MGLQPFYFQSLFLGLLIILATGLSGCGEKNDGAHPPQGIPVTVMTVTPRDVPIDIEFVGATESSHQVEIRARVEGFLEKKTYEEGGKVKAGQAMFQIDRRPFEAALQQARGALAQQEAKLTNAEATLKRLRPLAEKNAVSQKDLDDVISQNIAVPIELQVNGADNMIYMTSTSSSAGMMDLNVYFNIGTNPSLAQVDVQNRVNQALPQLPQAVTQQSVIVSKKSSSFLMITGIYSPNDRYDENYVANYVNLYILDAERNLFNIELIPTSRPAAICSTRLSTFTKQWEGDGLWRRGKRQTLNRTRGCSPSF